MKSTQNTDCGNGGRNIFQEYFFVKNSIKTDLEDIANTAVRVIDFGADELIAKCILSVKKNSEYLNESADVLYFGIKNAFRNAGNFAGRKNKREENYKQDESSESDAFCALPLHVMKEQNNSAQKNSYTSLVDKIILESKSTVKELAAVMGGKIYNSCGIKDRKPKRLWKWDARINYVQGLNHENISENDLEQINKLRLALHKNSYLKYKKPDYYRKLDDYLAKICI